MPRRRRDQQAPAAASGQPYGENQDQIQAQNVIPLPNVAGPTAAPPTGPTAAGAPEGGDQNPLAALLASAQGTPPPQGDLFAQSNRPMEPVTAGLPIGAGPGVEALGPQRARMRTVQDTYRMLADATGNPLYRRLADEAAARNL